MPLTPEQQAVLAEREACAKILDGRAIYAKSRGWIREAVEARACAAAIRDRTKYPAKPRRPSLPDGA